MFDAYTDYVQKKSTTTIMFKDIRSFKYGPNSSTFWITRKHINQLPIGNIINNHMPYYAWQCLTIEMKDRDVDLVISNEKDMIAIISLLIWKTHTVNGVAGTSLEVTNLMSLLKK
jgi:hypothetical protein